MSPEQDLKVLDEMTNQLVCQARSSESEDRTALIAMSDSFVSVQQSALEARHALKENIRGGLKFLGFVGIILWGYWFIVSVRI